MIIRAIRLAECGRFRDPVALEGLSGRLDVLAGPNELGKSTILRAMRFALSEKHTSTSRKADSFRPYSGGAPTIEIDLVIDAKLWRLRKRYLAQRSAELRCLDDNSLLRGEDAEQRLTGLLGGEDGKSRFPLLWLSQGDAMAPFSIGDATRPLLDAALAREVQAIAGGTRTRALRERIAERLAELVTTHATPRPRGRYEAVYKRVKDLDEAHSVAAVRALQAAAQRDRLANLRERENLLTHPEYAAARAQELEVAQAAREQARTATVHLATARQSASLADAKLAAARHALAEFDRAQAEHARLSQDASQLLASRGELAAKRATASATAAELATARDVLRMSLARDEGALTVARQQARRAELSVRIEALAQRLTETRAVEQRQQLATAELAGLIATEATLAATRRELNAINLLEARLTTATVSIAIAYEPDGAGRIRIGGRTLLDAERLQSVEPIVLEIAGVGRITVAPGGAETTADVQADIAAHRAQFTSLLARAGCDSLAALEAAVARRQALAAQLGEDKARLSGMAPGGTSGLERERNALAGDLAGLPSVQPGALTAPPLAAIEAAISAAKSSLQMAAADVAAADAEVARLRHEETRFETMSGERRQRLEALAAVLPPESERTPYRQGLATRVASEASALNEAVRQETAWQEKAPDVTGLASLDAALATAASAQRARAQELAEMSNEAARIEGELSGYGDDDAEATATILSEAKIDATNDLARIEDDVAALQLLAREIDTEQALVQDRYLAPVTARLQPFLDLVFPAATMSLDAQMAPQKLARGAANEPIDRLSDGTREQIAVLCRLAFARLLADGGHSAPLVLDDALVYSDDARIASMFRALETSSLSHQVIVLTCRTSAFAGLGGTRVDLVPWQMT